MSALHEWQRQFIADVITSGATRFDIHRNNWRSNLRAALRAGYPVIERLVGLDFFNYCADAYIDAHPSQSSNLENYGESFAQFIGEFSPASSLPYLIDVAKLEFAIDVLLTAHENDGDIVVSSPFPILKIWQANQLGAKADSIIDLATGGDTLRLRRAGFEVMIERISNCEYSEERKEE